MTTLYCHQNFHSLTSRSAPLFLGVLLAMTGCATTQEKVANADPYENFNRKVYHFNDTVDDYVAKPVSTAYKFITPEFMQTGVHNFFNNLKDVNVVLNDVLQGKFEQSAQDTGRLLMNTTLGMAGLFDVAKTVGLPKNDEDFEQTLAVWGIPRGTYLILPFLGPITTRGIPGAVFDTAANPASYVGAPIQLISLIDTRASAEGSLKFIDEASLDPYVFTRESFLQWRDHLATDGKTTSSTSLGDLDAEMFDDETTKPNNPGSSLPTQPNTSEPESAAGKTTPQATQAPTSTKPQ